MPQIVWIASYPKSGNTWVRFLVANLVLGEVTSSRVIAERVPDVHRGDPAALARAEGGLLLKTHWRFDPSMPLAGHTLGAIYIVRHPLDVLASHIRYLCAESATERAALVGAFLAPTGLPKWQRLGMGTWDENVRSWIDPKLRFARLVMRYEDLLADPAAGAQRIVTFLGLDRTPSEVAAAVERSSFRALKAMEAREVRQNEPGFFSDEHVIKRTNANFRFMNQGRAGGWRQAFSAAEIAVAQARFGAVAASFGYDCGENAAHARVRRAGIKRGRR